MLKPSFNLCELNPEFYELIELPSYVHYIVLDGQAVIALKSELSCVFLEFKETNQPML